jgi:hypothetical protein
MGGNITVGSILDGLILHGELNDGDNIILALIILGDKGKVDLCLHCTKFKVKFTAISGGSGSGHVPHPLENFGIDIGHGIGTSFPCRIVISNHMKFRRKKKLFNVFCVHILDIHFRDGP